MAKKKAPLLKSTAKKDSSKYSLDSLASNFEAGLDKLFFKRLERLKPIRRFVLTWIGLIVTLIVLVALQNYHLSSYYQKLQFVSGGIYSEGMQGSFTNANPIFALNAADQSLSKLVFASLFKYDQNGKLDSELASGYSTNSRGNIYTVTLKKNLKWQDGQPLTAKDVVFTFNTIENPDTQSPLFTNWQGIEVQALNNQTVTFKLPGILASFPNNLTTGIIPMHLLNKISPAELRSASFNTIHPIGAGPFVWNDINVLNGSNPQKEIEKIALSPNPNYINGEPKLDKLFLNIYSDQSDLYNDFKNKNLNGIAAVDTPTINLINSSGVIDHNLLLRAATYVFFKTTTPLLSDVNVRQALVSGADTNNILNKLSYETLPVNEPLLIGQLGYSAKYAQAGYSESKAKTILDSDGFNSFKNGVRMKGAQLLEFNLLAADTNENHKVASSLVMDWQKLGANIHVQYEPPFDFQQALSYHDYDAVLTSITIGTDPDVFVYWDSSQADIRSANRLNLSEYKNPTVDNAVESGRTRINPAERIIKYQPLLSQWQKDAPALGLYQPRLLYLTNGPVGGIDNQTLNTPVDRFDNVQDWAVREAKVTE